VSSPFSRKTSNPAAAFQVNIITIIINIIYLKSLGRTACSQMDAQLSLIKPNFCYSTIQYWFALMLRKKGEEHEFFFSQVPHTHINNTTFMIDFCENLQETKN
jgi:hypothetical protein